MGPRRFDHRPVTMPVLLGVIVVLAGCGAGGGGDDSSPTRRGASTSVTPSTTVTTAPRSTVAPSTTPTTGEAPDTSEATRGPSGVPVSFANIRLRVPQGWTVQPYGDGFGACIGPPAPADARCRGIDVTTGSGLDSVSEGGPYRPDESLGWYAGTDVPSCDDTGSVLVQGSAVTEKGYRPVGTRTAAYRRWEVSCQDGTMRTVERWLLPNSRILFTRQFEASEAGQILASATID